MTRIAVACLCLIAWGVALRESAARRPVAAPAPLSKAPAERAPVADPGDAEEGVTRRVSIGSQAPSVHAATAVKLPDGSLRAFWFGGSREGARDVAIWSSDFREDEWTPPRLVADRHLVARKVRRHIRKLGNPVAHVDAEGRLSLFVVSVSVGGWCGSAVNRLVFAPDGETLESANRLVVSPMLNLGTLVRGAAVEAPGGELLLPAYHEMVKKFPQLIRVSSDGRVLGREGPAVRGNLFQPWLLADDSEAMELFLRRGQGKEEKVFLSRRQGRRWTVPSPIEVPNPNSGISVVRLADGDLLLAANPDPGARASLVLLRAPVSEGPWEPVLTIETGEWKEEERDIEFREYSYPWMMIDGRGRLHVLYTWNRREIRHWSLPADRLPARIWKGGENDSLL